MSFLFYPYQKYVYLNDYTYFMIDHLRKFQLLWKDIALSIVFFWLSVYVYRFAFLYAGKVAGNTQTDILLDYLPNINLIPYLAYGTILFYGFVTYLLLKKPNNITYVLGLISLFICIRSFFMSLTHLAPQSSFHLFNNDLWMSDFLGWADLFFSGHTWLPFLLALIYWKNIELRTLFISVSLLAAISVLIARLHYSIDVFSAYFIVFGIYHLWSRIFSYSKKLFTPKF